MTRMSRRYSFSILKVCGVLFSGLGVFLLSMYWPAYTSAKQVQAQVAKMEQGRALAHYDDYPVVMHSGAAVVDKHRVVRMARRLTETLDHRAASELHYLVQKSSVLVQLSDAEAMIYADFLDAYCPKSFQVAQQQVDECIGVYKNIVNGIGAALSGSPIELVLHDVRNPPASIIAVQNTITQRRLGGSLTDFGIKLIKCYAAYPLSGESFIAYPLTLPDGRAIKASTIPLFHPRFGLVAFICMNIDTTGLTDAQSEQAARVFKALTEVFPNQQIEEMLVQPAPQRASPPDMARSSDPSPPSVDPRAAAQPDAVIEPVSTSGAQVSVANLPIRGSWSRGNSSWREPSVPHPGNLPWNGPLD